MDDAATTVLMEQFYTNLWSKKLPKLEALRQAQLTVLNNPGLVDGAAAPSWPSSAGSTTSQRSCPTAGASHQPNAEATRSNPALWAAFVLSGDVR